MPVPGGKAWRALDAMVLRARKGDQIVVDSGTVRPEVWTVTGTRPLRAKEHKGKVPNAWVFDCRPCRAKKPSMDDAVALNRLRELLPGLEAAPDVDPKAAEAVTARRCLARMVSVEGTRCGRRTRRCEPAEGLRLFWTGTAW